MTEHLLIDVRDRVATLTMNRPEVRNALSEEMLREMLRFFVEVELDDAVRCIVLRGAGGHFMAGADIGFLNSLSGMPENERSAFCKSRIQQFHNPVVSAIRRLSKPVIASVAGSAAGGGMSYAMACDLIVAAEDAFFVLSQVRIGASPDVSATYHLPRLVGPKKAMEIALLGDRVDAQQAREIGIVNRVVPTVALESETAKLATKLAEAPRMAIASTKGLIIRSLENAFETQLELEADGFGACAGTADWMEGVTAFSEKRAPQFG